MLDTYRSPRANLNAELTTVVSCSTGNQNTGRGQQGRHQGAPAGAEGRDWQGLLLWVCAGPIHTEHSPDYRAAIAVFEAVGQHKYVLKLLAVQFVTLVVPRAIPPAFLSNYEEQR